MKTTELLKKQALCEELSMNLDEANELFETETLESMQMAQINGGGIDWTKGWKLFCEMIGAMSDLLTLEKEITGGKGTVGPDTRVSGGTDSRGNFFIQVEGSKSFSVDSIVNGKFYGIKVEVPTPTPTPKPFI